MKKNDIVMAFLKDPDQAARRAEIEAFIGPNTRKFLPIYDQMRDDVAKSGRLKTHVFRYLCWPAFLGPAWLFYRKQLLWGYLYIPVWIVLSFTTKIGGAMLIGAILSQGRVGYLYDSIVRLEKLRRPDGSIDPEDIRRVGGVSPVAGWISGILYYLFVGLLVEGMSRHY